MWFGRCSDKSQCHRQWVPQNWHSPKTGSVFPSFPHYLSEVSPEVKTLRKLHGGVLQGPPVVTVVGQLARLLADLGREVVLVHYVVLLNPAVA